MEENKGKRRGEVGPEICWVGTVVFLEANRSIQLDEGYVLIDGCSRVEKPPPQRFAIIECSRGIPDVEFGLFGFQVCRCLLEHLGMTPANLISHGVGLAEPTGQSCGDGQTGKRIIVGVWDIPCIVQVVESL